MPHNCQQGLYLQVLACWLQQLLLPAKTHASHLPTRVIPAGSGMATAAIAAACKGMPHNCQQELYLRDLAWQLRRLLLPAKTCLTIANKSYTCRFLHGGCSTCCCLQRHMPHNCQQGLYLQVLAWWLQQLLRQRLLRRLLLHAQPSTCPPSSCALPPAPPVSAHVCVCVRVYRCVCACVCACIVRL